MLLAGLVMSTLAMMPKTLCVTFKVLWAALNRGEESAGVGGGGGGFRTAVLVLSAELGIAGKLYIPSWPRACQTTWRVWNELSRSSGCAQI
jgi:hypothetical protein